MAPATKLTLRWEEGEDTALHTTLKMKLPAKWNDGPVSNLKTTFLEHYNEKHPNNQLNGSLVHLVNPKGEQLSDEDVVVKVLSHLDTVRVKPGAAPSLAKVTELRESNRRGASAKTVHLNNDLDDEEAAHVNTAEGLKKLVAKEPKFAFDYSKWDRLDLSDDDGKDCHPNIDLESWKRLRGRQRKERREVEDEKIKKYKDKIDKYTKRVKKLKEKIDNGQDDPQLVVDLNDAEMSKHEYEYKLQKFLDTRKLIADDVGEVNASRTVIVKKPENTTEGKEGDVVGPVPKQKEYDSYESFQAANRNFLKQFAQMRNELESQEFLLDHPDLLSSHGEGFLLILTLDTCMKHHLTDQDPTKTKSEKQIREEKLLEYTVGKQHLTVHYICELAKSMKLDDPRSAVKPFYSKTNRRAQDKVEGFEEDLAKFLERIRNRAAEKISKGETSPLVDSDTSLVNVGVVYEAAGVGPGGLDPNEVLQSLPEQLQDAFIEQDTNKLREAFEAMTPEDAEYHLKRCIDSGLWVPGGGDDEEYTDEEGEVDDAAGVVVEGEEDVAKGYEAGDEKKPKEVANVLDEPVVGDIE